MKIIDPHLHLFNLSSGDYFWLDDENVDLGFDKSLIQSNFFEANLQLAAPLNLAGFVHIEAGFDNQQPWRELAWLTKHCQLPFRCIAHIDLTLAESSFNQQLKQLGNYASLVGIRHIFDDQAKVILSHENCRHNLNTLAKHNLIVEVQMPLSDNAGVAELISLYQQVQGLTLIINHAGWPPTFDEEQCNNWQNNVKALSTLTRCAIKCSGWEMMSQQQELKEKVINSCLQYFGEYRVMLASNFPLVLAKHSYQQAWQSYTRLTLSQDTLSKLCYSNAHHWYQF